MCEFCHQHGEGKKWYLRAENYSEDLLSDVRRRKFIREFLSGPEWLARELEQAEKLDRAPALVRRAVIWAVSNRQKKIHYGQVVPVEDLERILENGPGLSAPPAAWPLSPRSRPFNQK